MKKRLMTMFTLTIILSGQLFAQLKVEGYVKDVNGEALPGVNITIKGMTKGTVTNLDGYYSLSDVRADATLVYSFIGMLTEEIEVGGKTTVDVTLIEDIQSLDEVVVIGYGTVKRANLTGAVVDIKPEELEDIPAGDLSTILDGRMAGVKISSSTGKPGESSVLRIREESSFGRATEEVLYVIDGVISTSEDFNQLDATEVESISVLKDAAAAVYGARAAGGVVVVQTKKGSIGKPQIKFSSSYGIAQPTKFPEMLDGPTLARMYNEVLDIYASYGNRPSTYDYFTEDEIAYFDSIPGYNWLDEVLKNASTEKYTLNVNGGTERIKYFAGGALYNENGMMDMLSYKRYSLRTNVEAKVSKNLTAEIGINYSHKDKEEPNFAGESQSGVLRETYKQALTAAPWVPVTIDGLPVNNFVSSNPIALLESGSYKRSYGNSIGLRGSLTYDFPFLKGLSYNIQYSISENFDNGKEYAQDYVAYNFPLTGSHNHIIDNTQPYISISNYDNEEGLQESSDYSRNYQLNTSIRYSKSFGSHDLSALIVYEQSESESNNHWTRIRQKSSSPGYDYTWAFNSTGWENGSSASESGNLGFIGRLNYGYAQKYLFEGTFRYEASQKFHPDNRWGFFPAVSAGWVVSEENFFKSNIGFINFLKLRASAGIVGNDNITAFSWTPTFTGNETGPIFGDNLTNAIVARNGLVFIPSITWQETNSYNIGVDSRIVNNKIRVAFDYYYRHTYNVFNRRTNIPTTVGLSADQRPPEENYGEADVRGVEFEIGYDGKVGDFSYNIDANFSWDKKREVKLFQNPAVEGSWKDDRYLDPSNQPGYIALGIMRTQEQLDEWMAKYPDYTINGTPLQLGMIYYEDIRGEEYIDDNGKIAYLPPDGKITGDDITIIAEYTNPPYHYGYTLGLSYKGFNVNGTFTGVFGHKVFISKDEQITPDPTSDEINNVFGFWADYWSEDNPDAAFPRPYAYGLEEQNTTFWMRDGHTLRLKNLNASYTIPKSITNKLKIADLRIYFSSQNLWTIINPFDHKDPGISRGYDYPLMRTYNFGINMTL